MLAAVEASERTCSSRLLSSPHPAILMSFIPSPVLNHLSASAPQRHPSLRVSGLETHFIGLWSEACHGVDDGAEP